MKILEKFVLILYSFLMLIVSAIICLIVFKVITIDQIKYCIEYVQKDTALVITILAIAIIYYMFPEYIGYSLVIT